MLTGEPLRLDIGHLPCAVLVTDARFKVLVLNDELLALLGGTRSQWLASDLMAMLPPAGRIFLQTFALPQLLRQGQARELALSLRTVEQGDIPVLVNANRGEYLGQAAYYWVFFLVKERSRFQSELPVALRQLYRTKAELEAQAIVRAAAEEAARARSEFLATMSHEIRTPMNAVIGYLDLLQEQASQLPEASREHLRHAASSGELLRALLDAVLDFSKLEAGKLSLAAEPLRLGQLARDSIVLMRGLLGSKPVTLHAELDPRLDSMVLQGDALRIRQVLMNLASNAIKFTQQGHVRLSMQLEGVDEGRARIGVTMTDTGIGMTPEQVQRLFKPFEQADGSITRRFGGTGLGLSISQSLLKLMGSEGLQVSSTPGRGSIFSFELNLPVLDETAQAATAEQIAIQLGPDTLKGVDMLLVEDNRTNIALAVAVLEGMGAQVSIATDGQQALDLLAKLGPDFDVVLMDMQMPVMDGLTATRAIRANPAWAMLPIVALTANAYEADRQACLDAGMNDFLTKPLERARLASAIRKWVAAAMP